MELHVIGPARGGAVQQKVPAFLPLVELRISVQFCQCGGQIIAGKINLESFAS